MDRNEAKPYQVVFTDSPMAMTWMYPKPRAITRISVFPIPIMAGDELFHEHGAVIQCTLEYWDKCLKAFQQYSTFTLSEEKIKYVFSLNLLRSSFWNFYFGVSKLIIFLAKTNIPTQRILFLYVVNRHNARLTKIGHDFSIVHCQLYIMPPS